MGDQQTVGPGARVRQSTPLICAQPVRGRRCRFAPRRHSILCAPLFLAGTTFKQTQSMPAHATEQAGRGQRAAAAAACYSSGLPPGADVQFRLAPSSHPGIARDAGSRLSARKQKMALRGTGSLRALLGRDVQGRSKPQSSSQRSGAQAGNPSAQQSDSPAPDAALAQSSASVTAVRQPARPANEAPAVGGHPPPPPPPRHRLEPLPPAAQPAASPLKPGHVRCPVCNRQLLGGDDAKINSHIGALGGARRRWATDRKSNSCGPADQPC